jgi:hypothetical protein
VWVDTLVVDPNRFYRLAWAPLVETVI